MVECGLPCGCDPAGRHMVPPNVLTLAAPQRGCLSESPAQHSSIHWCSATPFSVCFWRGPTSRRAKSTNTNQARVHEPECKLLVQEVAHADGDEVVVHDKVLHHEEVERAVGDEVLVHDIVLRHEEVARRVEEVVVVLESEVIRPGKALAFLGLEVGLLKPASCEVAGSKDFDTRGLRACLWMKNIHEKSTPKRL